MDKLICDVCGKEAVGVCSSATGPASYAYCEDCLNKEYEPYGSLVAMVSCCGNTIDDVGEPYRNLILSQLEFHNKTIEEFHADVKKSNDEMMAYFNSIKDLDIEDPIQLF